MPTTGYGCKRPTISPKRASIRTRSKCGATNTNCLPRSRLVASMLSWATQMNQVCRDSEKCGELLCLLLADRALAIQDL